MKNSPLKKLVIYSVMLIVISSFLIIYVTNQKTKRTYSINFGYHITNSLAAVLVAQEKGYFEEEGLNVTLISFGTQPQNIIPTIVSGNLDGAFASLHRIIASISTGMKLKIVANAENSIPNSTSMMNLAVGYNSTISSISELKGKKVALLTGGPEEYILDLALKKYNISKKDVTLINADVTQKVLYIQSGDVHAIIISGTLVPKLENEKVIKLLATFGDLSPNSSLSGIVFSEDFIKENPDAVSRFVRAYYRGAKFANENHSETAWLISKYLKLDPNYLEKASWPYFPEKGVPSKEEITKISDWLIENGYMKKAVNYEDAIYLPN